MSVTVTVTVLVLVFVHESRKINTIIAEAKIIRFIMMVRLKYLFDSKVITFKKYFKQYLLFIILKVTH